MEQPAEQRGDPGQGPPLVLGPAPGGRAALQRRAQLLRLRRRQAAHRPARPARGQRGLAPRTPAPPPLVRRLRADPQPPRHLHGADILLKHLRSLPPHPLAPDPSPSGQATTIRVSHTSRHRSSADRDHAGAPPKIRTDPDPSHSTSGKTVCLEGVWLAGRAVLLLVIVTAVGSGADGAGEDLGPWPNPSIASLMMESCRRGGMRELDGKACAARSLACNPIGRYWGDRRHGTWDVLHT